MTASASDSRFPWHWCHHHYHYHHIGQIEVLRLGLLCQPADRYQKAVDVAVQTLVAEAVDQMMIVRKQKQVVINESVGDKTEQQHSPDTVVTPTCSPPAPVSTSTPADVCICVIYLCVLWSVFTLFHDFAVTLDVVGRCLQSVKTRLLLSPRVFLVRLGDDEGTWINPCGYWKIVQLKQSEENVCVSLLWQ